MSHQVHALRAISGLAATLLLTLCGGQALADDATRPAVPAAENWWDKPTTGPTIPDRRYQPANDPGSQQPMFRHDPSSYGVPVDYPRIEMRDWVFANTMAARSRALLLRAESELNATVRHVQQRFEHSEGYSKAALAEKQAYADYTAARQRSISGLANDPKYRAISQLRDEMGEKLANRRAAKDVSPGEILAMATLKMQYASDARAMEVAILSNDENVRAARDKMVEASRRLSEIKNDFDYSIRDNPECILARRNLEEARLGAVEAAAMAYSASISSAYAMNYSYFLHRNDNGGVYGPYGGGSGLASGGGYYTPYWGR
jgi:hypothetical protein